MAAGIVLDLQSNVNTGIGNTSNTSISGTGILTSVDTQDDGGNMVSAILTCNSITGAGNVTIKIQESSDNVTFTDLDNAATFTAIGGSTVDAPQILSFRPKRRYISGYATLNSGTSIKATLIFMWQKKTVPSAQGGWTNETGATA